jgi:hypothetical protein
MQGSKEGGEAAARVELILGTIDERRQEVETIKGSMM